MKQESLIPENVEMPDYGIKTDAPIWKRIVQNRMMMFGGCVMVIMIFAALFAPFLTSYDPSTMNFSERYASPSFSHLMGTDNYGRDVFSRILYGARLSMKVGILSTVIGMVCGVILGAIAGFFKRYVDSGIMRIMDSLMAFPPMLLAIALVAAVGPSMVTVSIVIGILYIPGFARIMRSSVLGESEKEYVEASEAVGQTRWVILLRHIGPNCLSPVLVMATVGFSNAILIEAALSFIGVGVPPPTPSWGTMLNESRSFLSSSIWTAIFPGLAISIAVLGLNLLGDGLRDFFDPKTYIHGG